MPTPNVVHVATSPIPFSSSDSGSERAESPVLAKQRSHISQSAISKHSLPLSVKIVTYDDNDDIQDKYHLYHSVQNSYEREKSCVSSHNHPAPIVQVSKTTAGTFSLPRENTNFTSRQIDLTEIEYARAVSTTKSHEKQFWVNKLHEARATDISTAPAHSVTIERDEWLPGGGRYSETLSKMGRYSEASIINLGKLEGHLDGTPSKWTKSSMSDYGKQFGTPEILEEARRAAKLPPRTKPTSSIPKKKTEANFAVSILRCN